MKSGALRWWNRGFPLNTAKIKSFCTFLIQNIMQLFLSWEYVDHVLPNNFYPSNIGSSQKWLPMGFSRAKKPIGFQRETQGHQSDCQGKMCKTKGSWKHQEQGAQTHHPIKRKYSLKEMSNFFSTRLSKPTSWTRKNKRLREAQGFTNTGFTRHEVVC